ncbi:hypothetical protein BGW80DRAFT_1323767 [Lactifluus volemus]|nr:hypothetical protein BGW80DRAFT_1323767 [Lactifluus volemus]
MSVFLNLFRRERAFGCFAVLPSLPVRSLRGVPAAFLTPYVPLSIPCLYQRR